MYVKQHKVITLTVRCLDFNVLFKPLSGSLGSMEVVDMLEDTVSVVSMVATFFWSSCKESVDILFGSII